MQKQLETPWIANRWGIVIEPLQSPMINFRKQPRLNNMVMNQDTSTTSITVLLLPIFLHYSLELFLTGGNQSLDSVKRCKPNAAGKRRRIACSVTSMIIWLLSSSSQQSALSQPFLWVSITFGTTCKNLIPVEWGQCTCETIIAHVNNNIIIFSAPSFERNIKRRMEENVQGTTCCLVGFSGHSAENLCISPPLHPVQ